MRDSWPAFRVDCVRPEKSKTELAKHRGRSIPLWVYEFRVDHHTRRRVALPDGWGNFFPHFSQLRYNEKAEGHAFVVRVENCGVGARRKRIIFKPEDGTKSGASPQFYECHRPGIARLLRKLKLDRST